MEINKRNNQENMQRKRGIDLKRTLAILLTAVLIGNTAILPVSAEQPDQMQTTQSKESVYETQSAPSTDEPREEETLSSETQTNEQPEEQPLPSEIQEEEEEQKSLQTQTKEQTEEETTSSQIQEQELNDSENEDLQATTDTVIMTFCGTEITGSIEGSNGDWSYDAVSGTLTLDNFQLTNSDIDFIKTTDDKDLTIYLKGDNTIQTSGRFYWGLPYPDTVTITGGKGATLSFKSLERGGFFLPQNVIIKDGVRVSFDTVQHVMIDDDLTIDNAELNVQCNGALSYLYINKGSLTVKNNSKLTVTNTTPDATCAIYMHQDMTITDSIVNVVNPNPDGLCIYMKYTTSNPPNPPVTHNAYITNSTVTMNGGFAGIHCDKAEIENSTITTENAHLYTIRAMTGEVTIDDKSKAAGIMASYFDKTDTVPTVYKIYGDAALPENRTIAAGETMQIPSGATLTIPSDVTLTNNGTMRIGTPESLVGSGTLTGTGAFEMDMNADAVSVPDDLIWQENIKEALKDQVTVLKTIPVCGKDFTVDYDENDWNTAYSWDSDELSCTIQYTRQSDNVQISKLVSIAKSAMILTGKVKTYKEDGTTSADTFAYGDIITVKATPQYQAADTTKSAKALTAPTAGEMAVFYGDTQLSASVCADSSGTYIMQADTSLLPKDSLNDLLNQKTKTTLTVKFTGHEAMTDAQEDIEVTITAEAKISMPDGNIRYAGKLPDAFAAENSGATVTLLKDVEISPSLTEGIKIENGTFTLDLNGHNISSNDSAIVVSGENRPHLTISGSGIVSGVNSVQVILGILTLEGGTFIGGAYGYGVRAENQSVLSVTGENVSIENTSDGNYGLYIGGTQSAKLSAGTYDGIKVASPSTLAGLLDKDTGCAYYRDGKPLILEGLGETTMLGTVLTGSVTVKECRHEGAEATSNDDGTHTLNCPYCGYTEQHATTLAATADTVANTVTLSEGCGTEGCEYKSTVGTVSFTFPKAAYGQTNQVVTCTGIPVGYSMIYQVKGGSQFQNADNDTEVSNTLKELFGSTKMTAQKHNMSVIFASCVTSAYSNTCDLTFTIDSAPLTVSGASAKDRAYDGTDKVDITAVTLDGIVGNDTVEVDTSGLQGTLNGVNAGMYSAVALPNLTLTGADKENYTLTQPQTAVPTSVEITRSDAEITVEQDTFHKTFGDAPFALNAAADNTEAEIRYEVTEGKDVVSVSDGMATIHNAGTAAIQVSLPQSANYNAAENKTITVSVDKKSGYTVDALNRSYYYQDGGTDSIDLAALLPTDSGNVTYRKPTASGDITYRAAPSISGGKLTYTLDSGGINAQGTITVTAATRNYEDITITVNIKLTDQIPVSLKTGTNVTLKNDTLTYGEPLSKLAFNEAEFVGSDKKTVTGTLAWKDAAAKPNAGTASAVWVFTPAEDKYASLEGTAAITVNRAAPTVSAVPIAADRVYNPQITLKDIDLSEGTVTGVDGKELEGAWSWQSANIVPNVNNSRYTAVFTPQDTTNYETVTKTVNITVTKAVPYPAELPTAASITYGDTLYASALTGGTVQYGDGTGQAGSGAGSTETVAGTFIWKEPSVKPAVADSNVTEYTIVFTPSDTANYQSVEVKIKLTVNKAQTAPNMPDSAMTVSDRFEKVGDVPLPENWQWQDADRETLLVPGTPVAASAVYTGADKDNYETTAQTIAITRINCAHTDTELRGAKEPACEQNGYSGDTYCRTCGEKISEGTEIPALGHDYESEITKEPTTETEGEKTYTCKRCGDTYTETIPAETHKGLWISGMQQSIPYTGAEVTQENISVYHNSTLLQEKTEYTVSYKNNKNAGTAQLIVSGKGNFTGKVTQTFTIEHIDLGRETQNGISATVATAAATGKKLKPAVTVTWNGIKLKEKKDYTLSYDSNITSASADGYDIKISGTGNYTGSITRKFRVVPKGTPLLNSAKVTGLAKSYPYQNTDGKTAPKGLETDLAKLTVKVGKTTLTQGTDYTVRVENADAVGTATLIIESAQASSYAGEKRIPVLITGTDLKKCSVTGLEKSYSYTGAPVTPSIAVFTGKNGTGTQIPADSYTVRCTNNTKPGKATLIITGIAQKGCSGTLKAAYNIGRANLAEGETAGRIIVELPAVASYAKGGAKPKPVITYTDGSAAYILRENIDYKLKYKNNTAVSDGSKAKQPAVTISGIGNYSGTITKTFTITRQDIGLLTIAAADKAYNAKKKGSAYYSAPKVYDLDGKLLKQNRDYTVRYTDDATGSEIGKTSTVQNGAKIRVTITAAKTSKSGYSGTLSTTYFVRDAGSIKDIAKAKADKIKPQPYTGAPIIPELGLYTKTGKTKTYLKEGEDYEIAGCYNNTQKGTAAILIKGKGEYSGIKTVTFKITSADNPLIWSGAF